MTLKGQVALVTGASRGIGQAIAIELARLGATVIGTATSQTGVTAINAALKDVSGAGEGLVLDVRHAEGILAVVEDIKTRYSAVSILVNNAGVTRDTLSMRMRDEDWDEVMDTNLKSVFRLSRAVMRDMMKARMGRIINIGSVVGTTGNAGQANYAAAKAGLVGMTKALAQEVASRGITINVVAPGFVVTPMTDVLGEAQRTKLTESIPLRRLGQPSDIAGAVAYLASDEAGWVTGATLHVNGGMAMI